MGGHRSVQRAFRLLGSQIHINYPLGPLSNRLRENSPGSKSLALLAPDRIGEDEIIRLFHWVLTAYALLDNQLWFPPEVLLAFVKKMKTLLDRQLPTKP